MTGVKVLPTQLTDRPDFKPIIVRLPAALSTTPPPFFAPVISGLDHSQMASTDKLPLETRHIPYPSQDYKQHAAQRWGSNFVRTHLSTPVSNEWK